MSLIRLRWLEGKIAVALGQFLEAEELLKEVRDAVATVTLNRPEQRNPLSTTMMRDLRAALIWCKTEPTVRVVILTGAGDRAFCAGGDLGGRTDEPYSRAA